METAPRLGTRAVERPVLPGQQHECAAECGERIKFRAQERRKVIYANVYEGDHWDRLECWHPHCYAKARRPHGPVDRSKSDQLPKRD
jgi:hypothetical protein